MTTTSSSIALCTYNGERFLPELLDSIAVQTVLPAELVICDDRSSDTTPQILKNFAASAPFPVHLHFNPHNLGYVKNFEKAISLCTGDIIFLCDQDDIWYNRKLEIMREPFSNRNIGMVFCNATIVDEYRTPTGKLLWQAAYFTPELQDSFRKGDAYKTL